jgi:hypothetical protein
MLIKLDSFRFRLVKRMIHLSCEASTKAQWLNWSAGLGKAVTHLGDAVELARPAGSSWSAVT